MSTLRRLVRNTAFTGLGFLAAGVVGIVLVPVLIHAYGIAAFGLLMLARSFLPGGVIAIVDLGVSENATQALARALGAGSARDASGAVTLLVVVSVALGLVIGAALVALAAPLSAALGVDATGHREEFVRMLRVTGAVLLVLVPGLVLEGVVKGFERFGLLRGWEVATTLGYAVAALALIHAGFGIESNQYAFIAALVVKQVGLVAGIAGTARRAGLRFTRWDTETVHIIRERSKLMAFGKVASGLQTLAPPLLVGAIAGPAGAGVYDVLTRLPRFLKPVLGILAAGVLPAVARLQGANDADRIRILLKTAFWLVPFATFVPLVAMMLFADPILRVWVGTDYSRFAPWLAIALVFPLAMVIVQFGFAALQVWPEALRASNRVLFATVALQFAVSFAAAPWLGERAFILGQSLAMVFALPVFLRLVTRSVGLTVGAVAAQIARVALPVTLLAAPMVWLVPRLDPMGAGAAMLVLVLWCLVAWTVIYRIALAQEHRALLVRVLRSLG